MGSNQTKEILEHTYECTDLEAENSLILSNDEAMPIEYMYELDQAAPDPGPCEQVCEPLRSRFPYSSTLRIEMCFGLRFYSASAALIHPSYALTARHNVYDQKNKIWAKSVKVIPLQNGDEKPFGQISVQGVRVFRDCDLALLTLSEPVDPRIKPLRIRVIDKPSELANKKILIIGYPSKNDSTKKLYHSKGNAAPKFEGNVEIGYNNCVGQGLSGAPVLTEESEGEYSLIAIHKRCGDCNDSNNYGVRITKERENQIALWMNRKSLSASFVECQTEESVQKIEELFEFNVDFGKITLIRKWEKREEVNENTFNQIGKLIESKPHSISHLELNFDSCKLITDNGIFVLSQKIGLKNWDFKRLILCFSGCEQITARGFSEIIAKIDSKVRKIIHLELNFGWCEGITNDLVQKLAILLNKTNSIQYLSLQFPGTKNIEDKAIIDLTHQIKERLSNIQTLHLQFDHCDRITNNGVSQLALIGPNLINVLDLELSFEKCNKITDEGIQQFIRNICPNLIYCQKLYLNFDCCNKISNNGVRELIEHMRPIIDGQNIHTLRLWFNQTKVTEDQKNKWKDFFKSVSDLDI